MGRSASLAVEMRMVTAHAARRAILRLGERNDAVTPAILALTVARMLPVGIALIGAKLDLPTVAVIGWFGPRGLASVVFALLALDGLLPDDGIRVVSIITATVLMSVILHGATAAPISWRYSGGSTVPATEPR